MRNSDRRITKSLVVALLMVFIILYLADTGGVFSQINDNLPPRETPDPAPTGNLPPRETTVPPKQTQKAKEPSPATAKIVLRIQPAWPGLWTVVQWQDNAGGWHHVDGWQGTYNQKDRVIWNVEQKDLGAGPFRWVVMTNTAGSLLAMSPPFSLPTRVGEILQMEIAVTPPCANAACGALAED